MTSSACSRADQYSPAEIYARYFGRKSYNGDACVVVSGCL
jgi:hypothetical protein